jgi:hypothetical protein
MSNEVISAVRRDRLQAMLLALVVIGASVKSYTLYASTLDSVELMPRTIASGQGLAPNQYRVLVPLLWRGAVALGIGPDAAERAIVAFSILFCYGVLAAVLYRASRSMPVASVCLLAFYGAAASGFWFRNRDVFFDAAFTAIGMDIVVQPSPRWLLYAIVSAAASLNRETWFFSLIAAGVSRWFDAGGARALLKRGRRDIFGLAAAAIVTIATAAGLRAVYGIRPYHYPPWQYGSNAKLLLVTVTLRSSLGQAIWFAGSGVFAVWAIFALAGLARHRPFVLGFMGSLLVVSFFVSNWYEARIFTAGYVVLLVSISGGLTTRPETTEPSTRHPAVSGV